MSDCRKVLAKYRRRLKDQPGMESVGRSHLPDGTPCIMCFTSALCGFQPDALEGVPIIYRRTGKLDALQDRKARHRPAPGGVSVSHTEVSAGTIGCLVEDFREPEANVLLLSNNHVIANSNDAERSKDRIVQPGTADGGKSPDDDIGIIVNWVPIVFEGGNGGQPPAPPIPDCPFARQMVRLLNAGCVVIGSRTRYQATPTAAPNRVDAAVAGIFSLGDVSREILEIGKLTGSTVGELGMHLRKSGRTTGLTDGFIDQVDVEADIGYGGGRTARFSDQIIGGLETRGGDSGSVAVDDENRFVALVFAGPQDGSFAIMNRAEHVLEDLGVRLLLTGG